jgi:serine/threonine-protein kinase
MGAVWLADHHGLKTQVVVKFMLGDLDSSESARSRFSREAAAAAQVKSPHVVQMLDHGLTDNGTPFIVMEHLEGHDLGDEIEKEGPIDPAKVVAIVTQVAKALSKVHAAGLLHRDIKPDNIFLVAGEEDVFAKLLDFGIAKSSTPDQGDGSLDGETKTGQIVGTPYYMSPEQVTAQKTIDHRADLWALGVVAYEAMTGTRPYDGPSFGALAVKIATGSPPQPTLVNGALPRAVDDWFAKACAREPGDRFSSAKELAEALRAAFEGIVSLPSSAINSDSGQRSGSVPDQTGPRAPSGGVPAFGLAATALDPADASKQALGRSEAGVSVVGTPQRTQPIRMIGATALTVLAAGAIGWTLMTTKGTTPREVPTAVASSPPPPAVSTIVSAVPAAASSAPPAPAPSAAVEPAVDAGAKPTVKGSGKKGGPAPVVSKPEPKPTAKPTTTDPDLF